MNVNDPIPTHVTIVNHALVSQPVPVADLETLIGLVVKHGEASVHSIVATLKASGIMEDTVAIDVDLRLLIADAIAKFKLAMAPPPPEPVVPVLVPVGPSTPHILVPVPDAPAGFWPVK